MSKREVRCTNTDQTLSLTKGRIYHSRPDDEVGWVQIFNDRGSWASYLGNRFEDVPKYPNSPHKHAEFIHKWADGAEIQFKVLGGVPWHDFEKDEKPTWTLETEYRVKPSVDEEKIHDLNSELDKLKDGMAELEEKMQQVKNKIEDVQNV